MKRYALCVLALAAPLALPATAAVQAISPGIDIWSTPADGSTHLDFARMPIPAGFFCQRSAPFTGRVVLQGKTLATGFPGSLGRTDTIVERLDPAVFDSRGVASTRLQMRALQLESTAPIRTACGDYTVSVHLSGRQPITRLRIVRDSEEGGHFSAPVGVNVKLSFIPVSNPSDRHLALFHQMRLAANPAAPWSANLDKRYRGTRGPVVVDTDGDGVPDTALPSTSPNFVAGLNTLKQAVSTDPGVVCHEENNDDGSVAEHCTQVGGTLPGADGGGPA